QLNRGSALIRSGDEREELARLNLTAGSRAKASAAYTSALSHLNAGASLLAEDRWERQRDLAFDLEVSRAECEFLTGEVKAAEARLARLSTRAADLVHRANIVCLRMELYMTLGQMDRAVSVGLEYLQEVGIVWQPHPAKDEARRAYEHIWL